MTRQRSVITTGSTIGELAARLHSLWRPWFTIGVPLVIAVAAVAAAAAALRTDDPSVAASDRSLQRHAAAQAFTAQRYADAYGRFAQLADEGDGASALMALAMVRHGPGVFGSQWSATSGQLERWSAMAVAEMHDRGASIAEHDRGE